MLFSSCAGYWLPETGRSQNGLVRPTISAAGSQLAIYQNGGYGSDSQVSGPCCYLIIIHVMNDHVARRACQPVDHLDHLTACGATSAENLYFPFNGHTFFSSCASGPHTGPTSKLTDLRRFHVNTSGINDTLGNILQNEDIFDENYPGANIFYAALSYSWSRAGFWCIFSDPPSCDSSLRDAGTFFSDCSARRSIW